MTINIASTIVSGQPTSGSCIASGSIYARIPRYFYMRVQLLQSINRERHCSVKPIGRYIKLKHAYYQQNFNITCKNGNGSVVIRCFTSQNEVTKINVQGTSSYICSYICNLMYVCMYIYIRLR